MIAYVSGPYSAPTEEQRQANIDRARAVAEELWAAGYAVICPHMNTAHMDDSGLSKDVFLAGDLEFVLVSDLIVLLPGWQTSEGARLEARFAMNHHKKVCEYPTVPLPDNPILHFSKGK